MSTATIAVANDADQPANSSALPAAPSADVSAPKMPAATTAEPASTQPSAAETSTASTGTAPPASDVPPASLAIPDKPEFGNLVIEKAVTPPPAPAPAIESAKAVVEPPPAPTPAELLGLTGKERVRAEKCLANAIYFEARGEPPRGQVAVAQVVMNRVFSPYYPKDVCGVVYQNADRHLACQFTFACDGLKKTYSERGAWWRAQRIAKQTLDGKVWIASVAKSTHYHAYWVNPSWVAEMKKMWRYGVHTFYRPSRWGDGSQEAGWVRAPLPVLAPKPQAKNDGHAPVTPNASVSTASAATVAPAPAAAPAKAVTAPVAPKAAANPLPKIDARAKDAKAAATKADTKAAPVKVDGKKSDTKISPIYTDGKRSDAKPASKTSNTTAAKSSRPAAKSTASTSPAKPKPAPKAATSPSPAKSSAKSKPSPKTADQTNPTRKL